MQPFGSIGFSPAMPRISLANAVTGLNYLVFIADYMTAKWGVEYTYETEPQMRKAVLTGRSDSGE